MSAFSFVVSIGNFSNGFEFFGPFESITLAQEFAEAAHNKGEEWFVNALLSPDEVGLGSSEVLNEDNYT